MTAVPRARRSWRIGRLRSSVGSPALAGAGVTIGGISVMRGSDSIEGVLVAAFSSIFMTLAWIDFERRVIPNRIVYPALALSFAVSGAWPDRGPLDALVGGLAAFSASAAIVVVSRGGFGGGDVKMATLVGLVVGYPAVLLAGFVTAFGGGLAGSVMLATGHARATDGMAYGPFIALGAVGALVS